MECYRGEPAEVIAAAIGGEIEGAAVEVIYNDHDDDPAADWNVFDDYRVVE